MSKARTSKKVGKVSKAKSATKPRAAKAAKKVAAPAKKAVKAAGGGVIFKDWGFRLAVIEALHEAGKLKAEMKRAAKAAEDAEPYTVSKAARAILDAIPLTADLLSHVRSMRTDGGSEVYHSLTSEWDGEDDQFEIRKLDDIVQLPKLETLTLVSMCKRGIDLAPVSRSSSLKRFACRMSNEWVKGLDAVTKTLRGRGVTVEV